MFFSLSVHIPVCVEREADLRRQTWAERVLFQSFSFITFFLLLALCYKLDFEMLKLIFFFFSNFFLSFIFLINSESQSCGLCAVGGRAARKTHLCDRCVRAPRQRFTSPRPVWSVQRKEVAVRDPRSGAGKMKPRLSVIVAGESSAVSQRYYPPPFTLYSLVALPHLRALFSRIKCRGVRAGRR